jgi:hypothetical protein
MSQANSRRCQNRRSSPGGTRQAGTQRGGPVQAGPPPMLRLPSPRGRRDGITVWERTGRSLHALGADLDPDDRERLTECPGWPVKDPFGHILGGRAVPARRGARRRAADHRTPARDVQASAAGAGELLAVLRDVADRRPGSSLWTWPRRPTRRLAGECRSPSGQGRLPSCRRAGRLGCAMSHKHNPAAAAAPPTRARPTPPGQAITGWMTHLTRITCRSGVARTSQPITKFQRRSAGQRAVIGRFVTSSAFRPSCRSRARQRPCHCIFMRGSVSAQRAHMPHGGCRCSKRRRHRRRCCRG